MAEYDETLPDGWWMTDTGRELFDRQINSSRLVGSETSHVSAENSGSAEFDVSEGTVRWRWMPNSVWQDGDAVGMIAPLFTAAVHRDGDYSLSNGVVNDIKTWTAFIIDNGIRFYGTNACATSVTGGGGAMCDGDRPVPFYSTGSNLTGVVMHETVTEGDSVIIVNPMRGKQFIPEGVVHLSPHRSDGWAEAATVDRKEAEVLLKMLGKNVWTRGAAWCAIVQVASRSAFYGDVTGVKTEILRKSGLVSSVVVANGVAARMGSVTILHGDSMSGQAAYISRDGETVIAASGIPNVKIGGSSRCSWLLGKNSDGYAVCVYRETSGSGSDDISMGGTRRRTTAHAMVKASRFLSTAADSGVQDEPSHFEREATVCSQMKLSKLVCRLCLDSHVPMRVARLLASAFGVLPSSTCTEGCGTVSCGHIKCGAEVVYATCVSSCDEISRKDLENVTRSMPYINGRLRKGPGGAWYLRAFPTSYGMKALRGVANAMKNPSLRPKSLEGLARLLRCSQELAAILLMISPKSGMQETQDTPCYAGLATDEWCGPGDSPCLKAPIELASIVGVEWRQNVYYRHGRKWYRWTQEDEMAHVQTIAATSERATDNGESITCGWMAGSISKS